MSWQVELILFAVLIVAALAALTVRDLLAAAFMLAVYSFGVALLFAQMGAVDVAFTEAAIGAGVSGVFFIAAQSFLKRRAED